MGLIKKPKHRMIADIIVIVMLGLIIFYFYGMKHECEEYFTTQCICPCAEIWNKVYGNSSLWGNFSGDLNVNQTLQTYPPPS